MLAKKGKSVAGMNTRAASSTQSSGGLVVPSIPADKLVSEHNSMEHSIVQLQANLVNKTRAYEERFQKLESILETISPQSSNLGNNRECSIYIHVRSTSVARKNDHTSHQNDPPFDQHAPMHVHLHTNFVKGRPALSETTHVKFMKLIRLEFLKFSVASDLIYWICQAK